MSTENDENQDAAGSHAMHGYFDCGAKGGMAIAVATEITTVAGIGLR